ncbi:hypothetical protein RHMOL_Rhmol08G0178100 [Rhododendron molle]|uniref:Uncharacterized protein n=1 Tax=Rhododendron molle TaxID=49168 RepID=A0ACC0MPN2_RHOML|nr:hypothetical protein RHMOL_Rhmol08G0178100 [Rhododendron molle]
MCLSLLIYIRYFVGFACFIRLCLHGTLSPSLVEGKIVVCLSGYSFNVEKGLEVKRAGGISFALQNPVNGIGISVDDHVLPGTVVFSYDSVTILDYIRASNSPTAMLIPSETVLGSRPAPFMAAFSSMHPNGLQPNILKPVMVEDPNNPGRLIVQLNPREVRAPAANPNPIGDMPIENPVCDANRDPCSYIVHEEFLRPDIPYPSNKDCSIMVMDLVPPANLWDIDEIVDIQDSLLMKDLAEDLGLDMEVPKATTVGDKGKRKLGEIPFNLWDVNEISQVLPSFENDHNVTRSGQIFQLANLQAGNLSKPSNQRNEPFAFPRSAPLEVPAGLPSANLVQRQLERIPAAISIWGLICSSHEHRQKLCHTLSRLEV